MSVSSRSTFIFLFFMVQANSDTLETVDLSGKVNKNWAKKEV
jgi:hypothetical protein